MNPLIKTTLILSLGAALGISGYLLLDSTEGANTKNQAKPLYWVAPMDPNYRRDQPGKSPMGMDLIPVYEEGTSGDSPGTVMISPEVENNLGVRVTEVLAKPFHSTINTVGYVGFNEDALIHVHPRVEGWLEKLFIKVEGERVTKGEPLFSIYSPELVSAQEELLLALERKNNKLIRSAKERLRALQVPEEQIKTIVENRVVSRTITIPAPRSGVISNLDVFEGYFVKPGKTILSVGPLDEVWVTAELFERQVNQVGVGDKVTMTLDYLPGQQWQGVVDYIYPTLEQHNRTARVRLKFNNQNELLKPNMFAQVLIHSYSSQDTLIVPREALIRTGAQDRVVLVLGEGKYKSVAVRVGRIDALQAEIIEGVELGDPIVSSAQFLLDSESSINSDFMRMTAIEPALPETVWAEGVVTASVPQQRIVTVNHKPVEAWQWPAMEMNFDVSEQVAVEQLNPGTQMHFEIAEQDGAYVIQGVHIISFGAPDSTEPSTDHSQHQDMDHSQYQEVDHSQHQEVDHSQHQAMDHSQHQGMDHSQYQEVDHSQHQEMDHSQHEAMDHSQHQEMQLTPTNKESQSQSHDHSGHGGQQ